MQTNQERSYRLGETNWQHQMNPNVDPNLGVSPSFYGSPYGSVGTAGLAGNVGIESSPELALGAYGIPSQGIQRRIPQVPNYGNIQQAPAYGNVAQAPTLGPGYAPGFTAPTGPIQQPQVPYQAPWLAAAFGNVPNVGIPATFGAPGYQMTNPYLAAASTGSQLPAFQNPSGFVTPGNVGALGSTPTQGIQATQGQQGTGQFGTIPQAGSLIQGSTWSQTGSQGTLQGSIQRPTGPQMPSHLQNVVRQPAVDVFDEGENLVIECELPGVKKEDLELVGHANGLSIRAKATTKRDVDSVVLQERGLPEYVRQIPTGVEVKAEKAKASFQDGILTVTVPKADPTSGTQKIEIK